MKRFWFGQPLSPPQNCIDYRKDFFQIKRFFQAGISASVEYVGLQLTTGKIVNSQNVWRRIVKGIYNLSQKRNCPF